MWEFKKSLAKPISTSIKMSEFIENYRKKTDIVRLTIQN